MANNLSTVSIHLILLLSARNLVGLQLGCWIWPTGLPLSEALTGTGCLLPGEVTHQTSDQEALIPYHRLSYITACGFQYQLGAHRTVRCEQRETSWCWRWLCLRSHTLLLYHSSPVRCSHHWNPPERRLVRAAESTCNIFWSLHLGKANWQQWGQNIPSSTDTDVSRQLSIRAYKLWDDGAWELSHKRRQVCKVKLSHFSVMDPWLI